MFLDSIFKKNPVSASFNKRINLLSVYEDMAVGIDGSFTIGFMVGGFDYFLSGAAAINEAAAASDLLLNVIDENISLQWIYKIKDKNPGFITNFDKASIPQDEYYYIKEKKLGYLGGLNIRNISIYLFCTLNGFLPGKGNKPSFKNRLSIYGKKFLDLQIHSLINKNSRKSAENDLEEIKGNMDRLTGKVVMFASKLNMKIKRMNGMEIADYFYEELNPSRATHVSSPSWEYLSDAFTLRSQLMFSPARVEKGYFFIDGYYYKFVNMHRLPSLIDAFGITSLLNVKEMKNCDSSDFFPYDVAVSFNVPDQEKELGRLQTERNIKASLADAVNGGYSDFNGKNITAQADEFLETVAKLKKKIISMSLCVRVKSRNLEDLEGRISKILEAFKDFKGMEGVKDDLEHHNLFISFLPGQSVFNRRFKTCISSAAASFFPLHESFKGTGSCAIPLINERAEAVSLDLYNNNLPSKHGIVFGKTRSGKGFMLNGFLTNFFMSGDNYHILGVDIGGTYSKFCKIFNGDYIELDLDGSFCLNPFPPKNQIFKSVSGENIFDADLMVFLTGIIGLMVEPQKNLSPNDKTIIKRAIQGAYDRIRDPEEMPVLSDINNILFDFNEGRDSEDKKRAMEMGKNLFQWTDISSPYNAILNRKGGIDLDNRVIIFDLQKLKGHEDLQKIIFAIIKKLSFKKMYDNASRVLFFYDECWEFMNDPKISELIMHLYKTSAKWGGMVWTVTQEPGDLLKSGAAGKSIIENSTIKIFCGLDGDVSENDLVCCGLNEDERRYVKELKIVKGHYSEYFLKFGKDSSIIRNKPDGFEYWLCCKSVEDGAIEEKISLEFPDISIKDKLILLAERFPNGPYGTAV